MAHINLLPWREELRREQQRQFLTILVLSVILMGLIILAVHLRLAGMIDHQESRNQYLQGEISKVEKQIKEINQLEKDKARLLARMDVIQQLQRNRPEVVHLFDEVARIIPDGIHLDSLKQSGNKLVLNGVAQSNARVSAFMRNIESSDWLTDPRLEVIQKKGKGNERDSSREFVLHLSQVSVDSADGDEKK
ncbi:PilN domain-containing protein [Thiohalophilus sp.]|uniref:PilN domain-containing protein n=1 Tax=Thiohalophilus sp. TaxID=3028392 RepID=UPI002ACD44B3|nr:PilN domain-containing protein [Thiohalophilus sp.]MDZ7661605.1 PilN domain-containing protein [Thiohalophilus sp.]MDZ7803576.1 PilN domain-containing protein [Thiohalophilus sp.]